MYHNRSSFFLIGFYTLSLVCIVLIVKFGVLEAVNPPSEVLRGLFVFACSVAGIGGGGIAIFFWKTSKYFIGAWGGFAFGLWIECFRDGGLIDPVGVRWILYIGDTHLARLFLWSLTEYFSFQRAGVRSMHHSQVSLACPSCLNGLCGLLCLRSGH